MTPLDLVKLTPLMGLSAGRPEVRIGLIDGPVARHPQLAIENVCEIGPSSRRARTEINSAACLHGTFVAGILCARRNSAAPAICPGCVLLARPVFDGGPSTSMPSATPAELARAMLDCIQEGARVLNISAALAHAFLKSEQPLEEALNHAAKHAVIVVVAAGNQGTLAGSAITRHPWAIPVAAYDLGGRPAPYSNLGRSIGARGLGAPGEGITSLRSAGKQPPFRGTSAAAPFVTGAVALLWSVFPTASAVDIKAALARAGSRRIAVAPPLLDAWAAYQAMRR